MKTPIKAIRTFLITLACALLMLPGVAYAAGEKITVTVIGPDAEDAPIYYVGATEYELADGDDCWTATSALLDENAITYSADNSAYGIFLNSITSPVTGEELAYNEETGRYWQLYVDGVASEVGISEVVPADGMQIVWYYSAFGDEIPEHAGTLHGLDAAAPAAAEPEPAQAAGMNGTGIAIAAVVVVAVIGVGAYVMRKRNAA